ncbi:MAG TPA: choice-of-anchor L domain-containing protein [Woeseiaceae bacterium]|nr:choice-of-anchor L domain-containing protein [Woeseiaceae bacterium]
MKTITLTSCLLLLAGNASALVIAPATSGNQLTSAIAGAGVTIDTATINFVGATNQSALFTDGLASGLGIGSGILLTSGDARLASGPNDSATASGSLGTAGDADLSALIGGIETNDANILEFEFTTATGDLFFNFVFASEEYNEFLGFIDPFGLFVDGVNYALAPDGQAISVGTVNCGDTGTDASGPNCASFNNNETGAFNVEYDGFTDVFTASVLGLGAGTHTMKFAISDASDTILDSAVFIAEGSFSGTDPEVQVPEPGSLFLLGIGFAGVLLTRMKRKA